MYFVMFLIGTPIFSSFRFLEVTDESVAQNLFENRGLERIAAATHPIILPSNHRCFEEVLCSAAAYDFYRLMRNGVKIYVLIKNITMPANFEQNQPTLPKGDDTTCRGAIV